jgi:hypothetical protein
MDENTKYFITLLSAFINRQKLAVKQDVDWEQVYKLARIHSVSGMVYLMAQNIDEEYRPEPELLRRMKKDFFLTTMRAVSQETEIDTIVKVLNEERIPHLLMKGYVVRNYYPAKEIRTMGDIDILIKPEDRVKSNELLQELGYVRGNSSGEVWDYKKGDVHLEIHTLIMYHNIHNGTDYVGYFSDAWKHTVQTSKSYTFEFDISYHFLYLLVHMAKHFDGNGCGIRMIMDAAVYINYFKDRLDWRRIAAEIEKLNLVVFSKSIYILCGHWFGTSFNFRLPTMEEGFYREISQYILSAGTFGFYQRNLQAAVLRNEYLEGKVEGKEFSPKVAIVNVYRKILFPSYQVMSSIKYYSFIKNWPWLLPVSWIYRFIQCALIKPKKVFRVLNGIAKGKEEAEKQYEVISKLGL